MDHNRGSVTGNHRVGAGTAPVLLIIQKNSHVRELMADNFTDPGTVLADSAGENQVIKTTQLCKISSDMTDNAVAEDVNGKLCPFISGVGDKNPFLFSDTSFLPILTEFSIP